MKPKLSNGGVLLYRSLSASMAAPRSGAVEAGNGSVSLGIGKLKDEENIFGIYDLAGDSPTGKKGKAGDGMKFPLSRWEVTVGIGVFLVFSVGLLCIYLTMPAADYSKLKFPRTLSDLRMLK